MKQHHTSWAKTCNPRLHRPSNCLNPPNLAGGCIRESRKPSASERKKEVPFQPFSELQRLYISPSEIDTSRVAFDTSMPATTTIIQPPYVSCLCPPHLQMRAFCPCIRSERQVRREGCLTTQRCSQKVLFAHPVTYDAPLSSPHRLAYL